MTSVVDRLRGLAERLPSGGSLVLTREGLLDLAAMDGGCEVVEYRVEQHIAKLGTRLEALRGMGFGTTIGTTA